MAEIDHPLNTHECNCKAVISLLDDIEETRFLSELKHELKKLIINILHRTIAEKGKYWQQCGKVTAGVDGDENTSYFHASASQRLRKNKIIKLIHNRTEFTQHEQKLAILSDYYTHLLGTTTQLPSAFNLEELYPNQTPQLLALASPLTLEEISEAMLNMNPMASPGLDGFGPGFYRKYWSLLKTPITNIFNAFHRNALDTESLNRALIVILPKKMTLL